MALDPRAARAARHAQPLSPSVRPAKSRRPITVERITDAALQVVASQGYDALTIRSVAAVLGTGPSSLYAHIVNKADIDDLLMGRVCSLVRLPDPDPECWQRQIRDVCGQLRDRYLDYPGISRAALAMVPTNLEILRVSEGMLAILLSAGIEPQTAAWAIDALSLYVAGYALEASLVQQRQKDPDATWILGQDELVERLTALPEQSFPHTRAHAVELTSGGGHARFDFALTLIIESLARGAGIQARPS